MDKLVVQSKLFEYIKGAECDFWSLNPYKLCDYRCTYCITNAQGKSAPVFDKRTLLKNVKEALSYIPPNLVIMIGSLSDAYPHAEEELEVTREVLRILNAEDRHYIIVTKGLAVGRDIDLLKENPKSIVTFSFSTLNDDLARGFELATHKPSARYALFEKFVHQGINARISISPWIPGVTDLEDFFRRIPAHIPITVERLKIVRKSRSFPILGKIFTQAEIDELYRKERDLYPHDSRVQWCMDKRFCQQKSDEEHPVTVIIKENVVNQNQLLQRGMLLEKPADTKKEKFFSLFKSVYESIREVSMKV